MKLPPLLELLFKDEKGYVLYQGHNYHRINDGQALLELALPNTIKFLPMPPKYNSLIEIKKLLPAMLKKNQY